MNHLLRLAFVVLLVSFSGVAFGQGSITGVLKDEKGNPVVNANVEASSGGAIQGRTLTDFDGEYTVKPLPSGDYTIKFSYLGKERIYTGISVADHGVTVNGKIVTTNEAVKGGVTVTASQYTKPIVDFKNPNVSNTHTAKDIENAATRSVADIAQLGTQVTTTANGLSFGGGRQSGTTYVIDGVKMNPGATAFTDQAPGSVQEITTFSSGIPAKYGDASGGIVSITTKGATARTQGSVQFEHSLDGYNKNQLTVNLSGPLLRKMDSNKAYRSIIGYNITADGIYAADQGPVYYESPVINPDKLAQLQEHPLTVVSKNGILNPEYSSQFVHSSDITYQKRRQNVDYYRGQLGGKLDFSLTDNVSLRVGGSYYKNDVPVYDRTLSLFAPDDAARTYSQTGRGYIRFTQKFGSKVNEKELKDNQVTNAFYTVQVDYSKDYNTTQDKDKKHSTFDYGYVGVFDEQYRPNFTSGGVDPGTNKVAVLLAGYTPTEVVFTPGTQNPILANYTKDAYGFNPHPQTQIDIQAARGLRNGDAPPQVYGLYRNVGDVSSGRNGWRQDNTDQVGLAVDASFDIKHKKTTHSIEFGLYYQQRNTKFYSVSGAYLWTLMRQFSNRVVSQEVDPNSAHYIINGVSYTLADVQSGKVTPSPNDTILYDRKFDNVAQGAFDKHLRDKLYKAGLISSMKDYINTDKYDPSFYSLDLFSADDLFNQGSEAVAYYGYDYTGKPVKGNTNFNDFWTAKDADSFYTRPIAAYRPNYIAGYLSDYIQYKDFRITLGVRVERFDNNTKVLKDPYSLYAEQTTKDYTTGVGGLPYVHPSNIGDDYVVYVGNNSAKTGTLIGYRDGDTWYDAQGREVADPKVLQTSTGSDNLQPLLQNPNSRITDVDYKPDQSFTDYKPQVNAMPRINFSFPLNDNALFYAHYDVMFQRPNDGAYATQTDYMFINQNPSKIYDNSNLKPERTIDYEVGFQQKLNDNSGVTIAGFYKERKDQIQVRPFLYAFPITYYAYGNRDYSTYKGLSVNYDLRRIGHISMNVNYTLSFAEGTGSGPNSANGGNGNTVSGTGLLSQLIAAGLPNLRTQFPLDYDSRHNINAQIDYRFRDGEGPTVGNYHVLENFGVNLIFKARSGEPYTKYSTAQNLQSSASNSPVIDGTVNGSRLPGHFGFDLNVDKTIALGHKTKDGKPGRLGLNVYVYAQNIFNIMDIKSVYGYTGRPDDDGFLTSAQGLNILPSTVDATSFQDLYSVYSKDPGKVGQPRTIFLGLRLNF